MKTNTSFDGSRPDVLCLLSAHYWYGILVIVEAHISNGEAGKLVRAAPSLPLFSFPMKKIDNLCHGKRCRQHLEVHRGTWLDLFALPKA